MDGRPGWPLVRLGLALSAAAGVALAIVAGAGASRMTPAVGVSPHFVVAGRAPAATRSGTVLFACQRNVNPIPAKCYGPDQIRAAYGVQPLLNRGINGSGRTIVIVDAFGSPTIAQDLHIFDQVWGLPDPTLNVIAPDGIGTSDPESLLGWAVETSLDVQWAHVIAPNAAIDLVIARSDDDADILNALTYAVSHNLGDTISMSFGEAEQCMNSTLFGNQHALFQQALAQKITLFASSGDLGAAQPTCDMNDIFKAASTPASDPDVTGVGGTSLRADAVTGYYFSERVWNEFLTFGAAGGGGFSSFFTRPNFQTPANIYSPQRGVPDVSYNGGIDGGVLVFITLGPPDFDPGTYVFIVGGTSAGSPQWAGLAALADQIKGARLGTINPTLYDLAKRPSYSTTYFHDILLGNNSFPPVSGFTALGGWDAASGLGTPRANNLVPALASQ